MLSLMTSAITPRAAQELWTRLGLEGEVARCSFEADLVWGRLPAGAAVTAGTPLFPRVEDAAPSA
jgi:methionyl-tRNA synthetase